MATGQEVVASALRKAGIVGSEQTPTADELSDGLETLNDMMNAWSLDSIDIGWSDIALADTVPVPAEYLRAIKYSLAVELCADYERQVPPQVSVIAGSSKNSIKRSLHDVPEASHDVTLTERNCGYNILTD